MFEHKKQLLHEVKVEKPNPQYCSINARATRRWKWRA